MEDYLGVVPHGIRLGVKKGSDLCFTPYTLPFIGYPANHLWESFRHDLKGFTLLGRRLAERLAMLWAS